MATVLIADDDLLIRRAYTDILEDQGYDVRIFDNGNSAVESCRRAIPDIIILDIHMPELNGIDACRTIRELPNGNTVPILIISGSIGRNEVDMNECGANKLLHKPIETAELLRIIREYLA